MKYFLWLVLLSAGCAKPNYLNAPGPAAGEEAKGAAGETCALQFPISKLCLSWRWLNTPDDHRAGVMLVKIWRPNAGDQTPVLVDVAGLGAFLKMANMPHGSAPVQLRQIDVGTYSIANVFFSMRGPWYIYVQLKDASGNVSDKLQINYRF